MTGQSIRRDLNGIHGLEAAMLSAIVTSSNDAIVSKTLDGVITTWNTAASRIFGYLPDEIIGRHITTLIPEELWSEEDDILSRLRQGERVEHFDTMRKTKQGQLIPVSLTISPMRDSDGRIFGASKIARDITERKRHEERQKLLLNELRHRIKNMLTTVGSIARQSFQGPSAADLDRFTQRLAALAVSYDYLINEDHEVAELGHVAEAVLAPFLSTEQIMIKGGIPVHLSPTHTTTMALALNELATNAIKYGALSEEKGRVYLSWNGGDDGDVHLVWREKDGPLVEVPTTKGFGSQILELALRHELGADTELKYEPDGLRFHMRFSPL